MRPSPARTSAEFYQIVLGSRAGVNRAKGTMLVTLGTCGARLPEWPEDAGPQSPGASSS